MSEPERDVLAEALESIAQLYYTRKKYENEVFPQIERDCRQKAETIRQTMLDTFLAERNSADEALRQKQPPLPKLAALNAPPVPSHSSREKTGVLIITLLGVVTLALLIPGLILTLFNIGPGITLSLLAIPCIIAWLFTFNRLEPFLDYLDARKSWETENADALSGAGAEAERAAFLQQCPVYEAALSEDVAQFATQTKAHLAQAKADTAAVCQKAGEETAQNKAAYDAVCQELSNVSLIHPDLVPQAHRMARLIRTGRADTVKEAANLALEEDAQERQEQARREEAARQEELLRQQAREAAAHNRAMERAAEEQNRLAKQQLAEQERANQIAEQERREAQDAARRERSKAHDRYLRARNQFNTASAAYRSCMARGATQDAMRFKAEMDQAQVDMLNSGWSE